MATRSAHAKQVTPLTPGRKTIDKVLLVGNPYNAFMLEDAGFRPRGVSEPADAPRFQLFRDGRSALEALSSERFDLVLAHHTLPDVSGSELVAQVRQQFPGIPAVVYTGDADLGGATERSSPLDPNLFIYYGAPSFWRALVKLHEDELNAPALLDSGAAMAILLVEDEPNFYSHFLPALYERIRTSAIELLPPERRPTSPWSVSANRPLVLLHRNFEEACETLVRYQRSVMALITDLCFPVDNDLHGDAGLRLLYRARALYRHLPAVVTSRDREHREAVIAANAKFLWKDSPRLLSELDNFLLHFCGFGPFEFRWPAGERYGLARSLRDLRDLIADIPDVVFEHHALHHDFSAWLAVHGHQRVARRARDLGITEPNLRKKVLEALDDELAREDAL